MYHVGEDLSERDRHRRLLKFRHLDGLDHVRTSVVRVSFKEHCSDLTISWTKPERNCEPGGMKAVYVDLVEQSDMVNSQTPTPNLLRECRKSAAEKH
jgi:hypothetical protein